MKTVIDILKLHIVVVGLSCAVTVGYNFGLLIYHKLWWLL